MNLLISEMVDNCCFMYYYVHLSLEVLYNEVTKTVLVS